MVINKKIINFILLFERIIEKLKELDFDYPVDFNDLVTNVADIFIFIGLFKDLPDCVFENLRNGTQVI